MEEPIIFADRLNVEYERRKEVDNDSQDLGLNYWQNLFPIIFI
jgi:hypothetical protein